MGMRFWCDECVACFRGLKGARFHARWTGHEVSALTKELKQHFEGLTRAEVEAWVEEVYGVT